MMTEREKIIEAINSVQAYGIMSNAFGGDLPVTNEMLADALIAAGIGDTTNLKAENAELRARLEKAVELPCKVGDTAYEVYDKCDGHNCPYNGCSGQWRCHYEGVRRCEPFIKIVQFDYCDIPFVNDTVFVSREAAEARLKEIKEKKDD